MLKFISGMLLSLCITSNAQATGLKAQLIYNSSFKMAMKDFERQKSLLEKFGLNFVEKEPDVLLVISNKDIPTKLMRSKIPKIILETVDSASLDESTKKVLSHPTVKAVFKNSILKPSSLYKENGVYHYNIINMIDYKKKSFKNISPLDLQKIQCVLWDYSHSALKKSFKALINKDVNYNKNRPIDIFFAGTIKEGEERGIHRSKALTELNKLKKLNVIATQDYIPKNEYYKLLRKAKIAVSPWGYGEWCWRDFEAIYSGAILIKPDTSFVKMIPDLYQNNLYYIPCKQDFSDLGKKISYVLKNYQKLKFMRKNAREFLIDSWDFDKHAERFMTTLKKALTQ